MDLRWCSAAAAADAAARLGLESPRYRDSEGGWWTVAGGRWQAWRGGAWHPASPPERVEGPAADLPAATVPPRAATEPAETPRSAVDAALAAAVAKIAESYRAGALSSDAAEAALSELYAVDAEGGIWTVGVRSGRWHRFHGGRWQPPAAAPNSAELLDGNALVADDSPADLVAGLAAFVAAADLLPEPVTEPWLPAEPGPSEGEWRPTHRVPPSGLAAWESPEAAAPPFASLAAGLDLELVEWSGAWAHVRRPGGWAGWVDGRLLAGL